MATLTVKNVGPIKDAQLDVKKYTVFIGPQGSGKSTLAKLIAIGGDWNNILISTGSQLNLYQDYSLVGFHSQESKWSFSTPLYSLLSSDSFLPSFKLTSEGIKQLEKVKTGTTERLAEFGKYFQSENIDVMDAGGNRRSYKSTFWVNEVEQAVLKETSAYIPAERALFPLVSGGIWSLLHAKINIPRALILFGGLVEQAYTNLISLPVSFLNIKYYRAADQDFIEYKPESSINLSSAASGYQSIIPLLLVVEHQRRQSKRRFIIEEPELNLYPTAQKDLIYNLVSGLDPDVTYQDAEWVFTTHSPYVLTSLNTLMLAYKVAQRSEELRAEVEKIIPVRHWINPDDFAAYYVDNGTVESITNPETGLINDSRLDDVSEDFAGEQDRLLSLYRNVLVND